MIGSGIFITSAESARLVGAPGWLLVAWCSPGLLTITGALCCAELAAMMPRAGGQYVFLREAYGRPFGFLFGWSLFLVVQTGTIAAVAVAFARFLGVFTTAVAADRYLIAPSGLRSLCRQPLDAAARRPGSDRRAHGDQHPGPPDRQADPELVHHHQDGRPVRADRRRADTGRQSRAAPRGRRRGGARRPTVGIRTRCRTACACRGRRPWCCSWARR